MYRRTNAGGMGGMSYAREITCSGWGAGHTVPIRRKLLSAAFAVVCVLVILCTCLEIFRRIQDRAASQESEEAQTVQLSKEAASIPKMETSPPILEEMSIKNHSQTVKADETSVIKTDSAHDGEAGFVDLPEKIMYLTFDDGPSPENTDTVLDILAEKNIKATFFLIGENVRKYPDIAKRIAEEGHTIGIHCDRHDYNVLYESVDSYLKDFEAAWQTVYEITGVEAELFRFPGGSINSYNKSVYEDIITEMTARGYTYFDWNASLEDTVKKYTPEQLLQNAKETTLGRKKIVMLAHDTVDNTALCLEELIDQFAEYCMEPLDTEVSPIQFKR